MGKPIEEYQHLVLSPLHGKWGCTVDMCAPVYVEIFIHSTDDEDGSEGMELLRTRQMMQAGHVPEHLVKWCDATMRIIQYLEIEHEIIISDEYDKVLIKSDPADTLSYAAASIIQGFTIKQGDTE